jgi:hypothetical protein
MTRSRLLLATATVACVLVPVTASASASDDAHVTWEEVRDALGAAPRPTAPARTGTSTVTVTIPDLSWALDDRTASPALRRAACHQITGLDDETAAPLAACLAHVSGPARAGSHRS